MAGLAAMALTCGLADATAARAQEPASPAPLRFEDAKRLSPFGERPEFSPDGKRIAFVGKSYGDAYEIDLATGNMRNLTANVPHQGFVRVHYLPDGNYLLTGPRKYTGVNSRVAVEMWVLDKSLTKSIQPIGEKLFEGIAISHKTNFISWMAFDPPLSLTQNEKWMGAIGTAPTKHFSGTIRYRDGMPYVADKKEIMSAQVLGCKSFTEPQDFRDNDKELVFYCGDITPQGGYLANVYGYKLDSGEIITYRREPNEYNEVEGIAPDGSWSTVECGTPAGVGLPGLDICKLEMKPGGTLSRLIEVTTPGAHHHISNPVVSPDGKWISFQSADPSVTEIGEGSGIYLIRIAK